MSIVSYAPPIRKIPEWAPLDDVRRALIELQEHTLHREQEQSGDVLDKNITWRDAVKNGLAVYSLGVPGQGIPGSFEPPPGSGLSGWDDLTPPDPLANLVVTSIPTGFFVEFDAPIYGQGGGNAYSIIYQANYSGAGPLPVFSAAVEVGRVTERGVILVIPAEPGVQGHFWAQPVSFAEDYNRVTPQTPPTGGLNGVYTVAGQLSDDHIADLSVGKLTAGSIGVSEYIQSTGFVSGSAGWKITGNGNSEFSNVVARGTVYASAGLVGAVTIDATGLRAGQTAYDTGTGFFLGVVSGTPKFSIGDSAGNKLTWNGSTLSLTGSLVAATGTLGALVIAAGGYIRQGQTAYATGTGFWLGDDSGTTKFSIGSSTKYLRWDGTDLELSSQASFGSFSASISGGDITKDQDALGFWTIGSRTITPSGGKSPYTYSWMLEQTSRAFFYTTTSMYIVSGAGGATANIEGYSSGTSSPFDDRTARLTCFVTDANGRMTSDSVNITAGFYSDGGGGGD